LGVVNEGDNLRISLGAFVLNVYLVNHAAHAIRTAVESLEESEEHSSGLAEYTDIFLTNLRLECIAWASFLFRRRF
jgi:hypothetical protein